MPRGTTPSRRCSSSTPTCCRSCSTVPFKPRAYEKAARAVGGYPVDLEGKDLPEILKVPSVGRSIGERSLSS